MGSNKNHVPPGLVSIRSCLEAHLQRTHRLNPSYLIHTYIYVPIHTDLQVVVEVEVEREQGNVAEGYSPSWGAGG